MRAYHLLTDQLVAHCGPVYSVCPDPCYTLVTRVHVPSL